MGLRDRLKRLENRDADGTGKDHCPECDIPVVATYRPEQPGEEPRCPRCSRVVQVGIYLPDNGRDREQS